MKITLLTAATAEYKPLADLVLPNKKEYCSRYNVDLLVRTHTRYLMDLTKAERTSMTIEALSGCDWLWFMGMDILITNMTVDVRTMIVSFGDNVIAIGHDANGINNDSVFFKNDPRTFAFLERTKELQVKREVDQDQNAMKRAFQDMPELPVSHVSHKLFNAYPMAPMHPGAWAKGDFVAHFPSMSLGERVTHMAPYLLQVVR